MVDFFKYYKHQPKKKEPQAKIESVFEYTTADWNKNLRAYSNKETKQTKKELEIYLREGKYGTIVDFVGGPTGYESYYLYDFIRNIELQPYLEYVFICAGKINSWPSCKVNRKELLSILESL